MLQMVILLEETMVDIFKQNSCCYKNLIFTGAKIFMPNSTNPVKWLRIHILIVIV